MTQPKFGNLVSLCFQYFNMRDVARWGSVKYNIYKQVIKYITNSFGNDTLIRRIFDKMVLLGYIDVIRLRKNNIRYLFNPYKREYKHHMSGRVEFIEESKETKGYIENTTY